MGQKAGSSYGLGVVLGFASWRAYKIASSQNVEHEYRTTKSDLNFAKNYARNLSQNGMNVNINRIDELMTWMDTHSGDEFKDWPHVIEGARGDYREAIGGSRNGEGYVLAFDLGLALAIAEANATTHEYGNQPIITSSWNNAYSLAQKLNEFTFMGSHPFNIDLGYMKWAIDRWRDYPVEEDALLHVRHRRTKYHDMFNWCAEF